MTKFCVPVDCLLPDVTDAGGDLGDGPGAGGGRGGGGRVVRVPGGQGRRVFVVFVVI